MRTAFAWAAGLVTTLVLTFLFHRVMMGEQFDAVFAKLGGAPVPVLGIIMYSVVTAILVYLYRKVYTGASPVLEGFRLGAVIGLLFITPLAGVFVRIGVSTLTIVLDVLWHTFVEHALAGVAVGLVFGREASPSRLGP